MKLTGLYIVNLHFQIGYVPILTDTYILISIQSNAGQYIVNCRNKLRLRRNKVKSERKWVCFIIFI